MNLNDYLVEFIVGGSLVGLLGLWLVFTVGKKHPEKKEELNRVDVERTEVDLAVAVFKQEYKELVDELISFIKGFLFHPEIFTETYFIHGTRYGSTCLQMVRGLDKDLVVVFIDRLEFLRDAKSKYRHSLGEGSIYPNSGIDCAEGYGSDHYDPFGILKSALNEAGLVEGGVYTRTEQQFYKEVIDSTETPIYIYLAGSEPIQPPDISLPNKFSELLVSTQVQQVDYSDYLTSYLIEPALESLRGEIKEAFLTHLERRGKVLQIGVVEMEFSLQLVKLRFSLNEYESDLISKYTGSLHQFAVLATENFEDFFADFLGQFEPEEGVVFMRGATRVGSFDHRDTLTTSLVMSELSYEFHLVNPIA